MFSQFTLRVRQYLSIRSVIFLLPQELRNWVSQSGVRLPFQHEGTDAKPDRSKQPIGKRSGVGGRTVTLRPICDGTSTCKLTYTVGLPIPRHAISQESFVCPSNTDTGPFCQSFLDPLSYNGIRTHNLSMILMGKQRPQQR